MKLVPIDRLPVSQKNTYKKRGYILKEFMRMNVKYARFEFSDNEYASVGSACISLRKRAEDSGDPIDIKVINGEAYLIRKDLEEVSV